MERWRRTDALLCYRSLREGKADFDRTAVMGEGPQPHVLQHSSGQDWTGVIASELRRNSGVSRVTIRVHVKETKEGYELYGRDSRETTVEELHGYRRKHLT